VLSTHSDSQNKCYNTGVHRTPFFMKYLKALVHPVTQINGLLILTLISIGVVHNHAHHTMEVDVDSYVRQFCKKNVEKCKSFFN